MSTTVPVDLRHNLQTVIVRRPNGGLTSYTGYVDRRAEWADLITEIRRDLVHLNLRALHNQEPVVTMPTDYYELLYQLTPTAAIEPVMALINSRLDKLSHRKRARVEKSFTATTAAAVWLQPVPYVLNRNYQTYSHEGITIRRFNIMGDQTPLYAAVLTHAKNLAILADLLENSNFYATRLTARPQAGTWFLERPKREDGRYDSQDLIVELRAQYQVWFTQYRRFLKLLGVIR